MMTTSQRSLKGSSMHEHAYEPLVSVQPQAPTSNGASDFKAGRQEQWIRAQALSAAVATAHHESMSGENPWSYQEIMTQAILYSDYIRDGKVYGDVT
jgi:hypothetical protein